MTAEEYWKALCAKNPALANREVVTIKVSGLKAMVKQAHDKGFEACAELIPKPPAGGHGFFDGISKGKR